MASSSTALVLIDIQLGFDHPTHWGERSNPEFETNVIRLLKAFRAANPKPHIIHVQHLSKNPSSPLYLSKPEIKHQPYASPEGSEPIVTKHENSAFVNTNLEAMLREKGITKLYICGLTTDQCVSTTTRMAANMHVCDTVDEQGNVVNGHIILVGDATAAHELPDFSADVVQAVHIATLGKEFCTVVSTDGAISQVSGYRYQGGLGYYESPRDAATNFFIGSLPKGTHVFEYRLRAAQSGDFSGGLSQIQCLYAPEFTSHSAGQRLQIGGN